MINAQMKTYEYFSLGERNAYGEQTLSNTPVGTIKMAINISSQAIQDNVNYKEAKYIGLTQAEVNDTYVIKYNEGLLKVLYINPLGRYKQVFLTTYE